MTVDSSPVKFTPALPASPRRISERRPAMPDTSESAAYRMQNTDFYLQNVRHLALIISGGAWSSGRSPRRSSTSTPGSRPWCSGRNPASTWTASPHRPISSRCLAKAWQGSSYRKDADYEHARGHRHDDAG